VDRDLFYLETSVPGIFVAGDVRHRSAKGVTSGVGEGAMAVKLVHEYLSTLYTITRCDEVPQTNRSNRAHRDFFLPLFSSFLFCSIVFTNMNPSLIETIRQTPLFAGLKDGQLDCIRCGEVIEVQPGTVLVEANAPAKFFFLNLD